MKLADLVGLYAGLARLGTTVQLSEQPRANAEEAPAPRRLVDAVAAWYVDNILLGTPPPENAAGGRIAFKTGTSYGYRDAWAVGFDGTRTIGVWVGRPDGAPVPGLTGRLAAAPVLFDAFARTETACAPCQESGWRTRCRDREAAAPAAHSVLLDLDRHRRGATSGIMFLLNGARLELANDEAGRPDLIPVKVTGGAAPLTVLVNGLPLADGSARRTLFFQPDGPGFVRLTVMDARGVSDSVMVRLQ